MSPQGLLFLLFFCYLSLSSAAIPAYSLSDKQIIGGSTVQLLNGKWDAFSPSQNIKISGNVPGDIASDLYLAGIIPDPISDINFITYGPMWAKHLWTYNTTFILNSQDISNLESSAGDILLVFDGIKMGANIYINNYLIDTSISQFLRLNFSLSAYQQQTKALIAGENYLSVVFDPALKTNGLFAQCSGGWDWAPFTQLESSDGFNIFSIGIWKDVYLVWVPWVAIVDTVVHTYYTGPFQTTALQAGKHSPFEVSVSLFTYNYLNTSVSNVVLQVLPSWLNGQAAIKTTVEILPGYNKLVVPAFNATADEIQLWWPSGYGSQPLYNIQVTLTNPSTSSQLVDEKRIGFRVAHMTTGNDTNPNYVQSNTNTDGSDSFGLMWRINGQAIYNRGANVIPMSDMEGRYNAFAHRQMVLSARDGMMNTLRIWGGGVYLPQIFYDTCDEVGIMVLHDMMNRGSWLGIPEETYAYLHQTRRLSYHPSIIVWNGCNECRGQNNVVPFTVTVVAREDPSRVIWPSCPADGWKTGVERLTGLPNGNPLAMSPSDNIEVHGPYQHGGGWPAVNGDYTKLDLFDPMTPPQEYPSNRIGLGQPNTFTSEFGTATWSSFESVSATLSSKYWSLHGGVPPDTCTGSWDNNCTGGNPLAQRNYPCDNIYVTYYGENSLKELDQVGESAFKQQLFKCVIGSALAMKAYIEETRSRNCFGTLVWQLNEIWPTGGWGSIEYGSEATGQVLGGRWKPTHYWMRKSLFTDILIACGVDGKLGSFLWCYVKNDSPNAVSGTLSFSAVEFSDANSVTTVYSNASFSLASGPDTQQWFKVDVNFDPSASLLEAQYINNNNETMSYNNMLLSPPSDLTGVSNFTISLSVSSSPNPDQSVDITLTKTSPALGLYVTLTTAAQGRFSENSFIMTTNSIIVQYIPFGDLDLDILTSTVRVEHLGNYL